MNHYTALGIPRTATAEEITAAWRRASLDSHPDRPGGDRARFERARMAYDVLRDAARRRRYDAQLQVGQQPAADRDPNALAAELLEEAAQHITEMRSAAQSRDFWRLASSTFGLVGSCMQGVARAKKQR